MNEKVKRFFLLHEIVLLDGISGGFWDMKRIPTTKKHIKEIFNKIQMASFIGGGYGGFVLFDNYKILGEKQVKSLFHSEAKKGKVKKIFGNWSKEEIEEEIENLWDEQQLIGERIIDLQEELGKKGEEVKK